jgi:hypothetical protein
MKNNKPQFRGREARAQRGLSPTLESEFSRFIEYHPADRVSRNLRKMLLEFLMAPGADEVLYIKDLLYDLDGLFELLDCVEMEWERRVEENHVLH